MIRDVNSGMRVGKVEWLFSSASYRWKVTGYHSE